MEGKKINSTIGSKINTSYTVGGEAMTLEVNGDATTRKVRIYSKIQPPTGSQTITLSGFSTSPNGAQWSCYYLSGTDTTNPIRSSSFFNSNNVGAQSITRVSEANDLVIDVIGGRFSFTSLNYNCDQSAGFISLGNRMGTGYKFASGTSTNSCYTFSTNYTTLASIAIKPASSPTATPTATATQTSTPTATATATGTVEPTSPATETATPTSTGTPTPATQVTYTYDGDGNLVMSQIGSTVTFYPNVYYEIQGTTIIKYYFAAGKRIAMREDGAVTFLLADHLGSTSVTTDSTGVLVSSMLYTAFGETRIGTGMTASDYLYTGQREESEIGLYFYNARFYDAALARFISADTIVPQPGDPLAWDRYAYVRNNPINGTDPSGHAFCMDGDQFCYDPENQQWLGNLPSQLTFTFYTSLPTAYTDHDAVFEQSVAELSQVGIIMGRVLVEPVDWGFVAYDCLQGTCNLWDFAGLLPLLPAGITKYGDDAVFAMLHLDDIVIPNGQYHHVFSNKIMKELNKHANLKGIFTRNDFIVQALDSASHRGYQKWHRIYDQDVGNWLAENPLATSAQFLEYMRDLYQKTDLSNRFPDGWKLLEMAIEELK